MNTRLLKQVRDKILAEPRQFNMADWFCEWLPGKDHGKPVNCGTAACIGGWAMCLSTSKNPATMHGELWPDVRSTLGLTHDQANVLFYEDNWPKQFRSRSNASLETRAKSAADRIDHFIKTKGKE